MNPPLLAGAAALVLSLLLGAAATRGMLACIDTPLMQAGTTPAWAIRLARVFTHMGDPGVRSLIVIGIAALLIARQNGRMAGLYVLTCVLTITGYTLAKRVYGRARPQLTPWLSSPTDPSFPSGHAAGATVVLVLAALLIDQSGLVPAALALATGIGLSRIALGVHWPSDVVGGWLFGGGAALLGYAAALRIGDVPVLFR